MKFTKEELEMLREWFQAAIAIDGIVPRAKEVKLYTRITNELLKQD